MLLNAIDQFIIPFNLLHLMHDNIMKVTFIHYGMGKTNGLETNGIRFQFESIFSILLQISSILSLLTPDSTLLYFRLIGYNPKKQIETVGQYQYEWVDEALVHKFVQV